MSLNVPKVHTLTTQLGDVWRSARSTLLFTATKLLRCASSTVPTITTAMTVRGSALCSVLSLPPSTSPTNRPTAATKTASTLTSASPTTVPPPTVPARPTASTASTKTWQHTAASSATPNALSASLFSAAQSAKPNFISSMELASQGVHLALEAAACLPVLTIISPVLSHTRTLFPVHALRSVQSRPTAAASATTPLWDASTFALSTTTPPTSPEDVSSASTDATTALARRPASLAPTTTLSLTIFASRNVHTHCLTTIRPLASVAASTGLTLWATKLPAGLAQQSAQPARSWPPTAPDAWVPISSTTTAFQSAPQTTTPTVAWPAKSAQQVWPSATWPLLHTSSPPTQTGFHYTACWSSTAKSAWILLKSRALSISRYPYLPVSIPGQLLESTQLPTGSTLRPLSHSTRWVFRSPLLILDWLSTPRGLLSQQLLFQVRCPPTTTSRPQCKPQHNLFPACLPFLAGSH